MPHEKTSLPLWQNGRVINTLMRPYYTLPDEFGVKELPYHNLAHSIETPRQDLAVARLVMPLGLEIMTSVLKLGGRVPDAGFWLRPGIDHPFATKEEFSADITNRVALQLGMPEPERKMT